jgi:hypothetical protein
MYALGILILIIGIFNILGFFSLTHGAKSKMDKLAIYYLICGAMNIAGGIIIIISGGE